MQSKVRGKYSYGSNTLVTIGYFSQAISAKFAKASQRAPGKDKSKQLIICDLEYLRSHSLRLPKLISEAPALSMNLDRSAMMLGVKSEFLIELLSKYN